MAVTLDSLDDSLIERKQKEVKRLESENDELRLKLSHMTDSKESWNNKYNNLLIEFRELERKNCELEKKMLHYEHDPIIMEVGGGDGEIDILYWDTETDDYEVFACFYENRLEKDLEEFCKEFIMELKDAYMVE